jgi:tetratricopeptide (TPR) repeat protein
MPVLALGLHFVLILLLGLSGAPRQEGAERRQWIETVVPRMEDAAAQLGHARRLKRQMWGKEGEDLDFWRALAVEAYQAVRLFHPGARQSCVEAAFRAGEILRAGAASARALEEFRWALRNGEGSDFRARAGLEIGHLHRRAKRWREALQSYMDVAADPGAEHVRREDAWLWAGAAWQALGREEEARRAWRRIADDGRNPLARVRAYDELGLLLLGKGDLEGAAGVLDQCLRALSQYALEETEMGERVRNALLRMRVVEQLQREIDGGNASSAEHGTSRKTLTR